MKIYNNLPQFTVEYLGGTFDRKSVLRGTQSLCATLTDIQTYTKGDGDTDTATSCSFIHFLFKQVSIISQNFGRHNGSKTHATRQIITFCHPESVITKDHKHSF